MAENRKHKRCTASINTIKIVMQSNVREFYYCFSVVFHKNVLFSEMYVHIHIWNYGSILHRLGAQHNRWNEKCELTLRECISYTEIYVSCSVAGLI